MQILLLIHSGIQVAEILVNHFDSRQDENTEMSDQIKVQISIIVFIVILNTFCLIIILKWTNDQKLIFICHATNLITSVLLQEFSLTQSKMELISFSLVLIVIIHSYQKLFLLTKRIYPIILLLLQQIYLLIRNIQYLNLNVEQSFQLFIILILAAIKALPFNEGYFFDSQSTYLSTKNIQSIIQKGKNIHQSESQFGLNNQADDYKKGCSKNRLQEQNVTISDKNMKRKQENEDGSKQNSSKTNKNKDYSNVTSNINDFSHMYNPIACDSRNGVLDYFDILSTGILFLDEKKNIIMQNKPFSELFKKYFLSDQDQYSYDNLAHQGIEISDILKISLKYELPKCQLSEKKDNHKQGEVVLEETKNITEKFEENSKHLKEFFLREKEKSEQQQLKQSIQQYENEQRNLASNSSKSNSKRGVGGGGGAINNENDLSQIVSDRDESIQSRDMRHSNLITNQSSWIFNNSNVNGPIDITQYQNHLIIDSDKIDNNDMKIRKAIFDFQQRNLSETLKKSKQCRISKEGIQKFIDLDPIELDLERLIDYLLISKPFNVSEKGLQYSFNDDETDYNFMRNKKGSSLSKEGKYRLKIQNNTLIISMMRSLKNKKKNEVIEIKITCFCYDEQLTSHNIVSQNQQCSNQLQQIDCNGTNQEKELTKNQLNKKQNKSTTGKGLSLINLIPNKQQQSSQFLAKEEKSNQKQKSQIEERKTQQRLNQFDSRDELTPNQNIGDYKYFLIIEAHEVGLNIQNVIKHDIDKYRTKILCSVSHELRTPLNCTITMLDMLNYREDIPDLVKNLYINPALFSSYILLNIINDILDMAEVNRTGQISMNFQEFSPVSVCLECLKFIKLQAMQKNLQLDFFVDENVPSIIYTDISKTRQVILNLLNNALKYTQKGSISIRLSSPQENLVQVEVKDTGCGIPQHALKQIFFNFTQPKFDKCSQNQKFSDTTTQKTTINAGLGLSISYCLAACLGNNRKMNVTSQVDKGSTFTFYLSSRPQKKKGVTLFPNMKQQQEGQNSSMNSRDWVEYDSYLHSQGKITNQEYSQNTISPSIVETNIESSIKNIGDSQKEKQIKSEQDCDIPSRDIEYHSKKPSSNRLIKNNLHFLHTIRSQNQINYHRNPQQVEDSDNQNNESSKEELYPETDRYIGKTLKKYRTGSAVQINLSRTTLQIIKQASTIFQMMQSQRDLDDCNSAKKHSSSSSKNLGNQITLEQQHTLDPQLTMDQHLKGCLTKVFTDDIENTYHNQNSVTSMLFRNKNTEHMITLGTLGTREMDTQSRQHGLSYYNNSNSKRTTFSSRVQSSKYIKDKNALQYDALIESQSIRELANNNNKMIAEDSLYKKLYMDDQQRKSQLDDPQLKKSLFDDSSNFKTLQDEVSNKKTNEDQNKKTIFLEENKKFMYGDHIYKNMIYEEVENADEQEKRCYSLPKDKDLESCNVLNESFEKKPSNSITSPQTTRVKLFSKQKNEGSYTEQQFKQQLIPTIFKEQKQSNSYKNIPPEYKQSGFQTGKSDNKQLLKPSASIQVTFHPDTSITNSSIYNQTSIMNNNTSSLNNQLNAFNLNSNLNCLNTNIQVMNSSNHQYNLNSNYQSSNHNSLLNTNYFASSLYNNVANQASSNSQNGFFNIQNSSINNINQPNQCNNNNNIQTQQSTLNNIEPQLKCSIDVFQEYKSQILQQGYALSGEELRQFLINMNSLKQCSCPQILIVDDNEFNLYALEIRLKMYQFNVDKATSGFQSLELIEKRSQQSCCKNYDLVFMDIDMPLKNGYETTEEMIQLCSSLLMVPPPISACSAFIQESDKEKAYKSGMSYYLTKPINQSAFENILMKVYLQKQ